MKLSRSILTFVVCLSLTAGSALAQKWEIGVSGGGSIYKDQTISGTAGSASAGFESGYALGAVLGQNLYKHLGGEIRYTFEQNDMRLSSGSTKVTFGGQAHQVEYDVLILAGKPSSSVRPYLLLGGGMKFYQGTGTEVVFQPLGNIALLTKTRDTQGLVTAGAGVKFKLSKRVYLRFELRDSMTPFPKKVIAPVGNAKVPNWMQDFVPMFGISYAFSGE